MNHRDRILEKVLKRNFLGAVLVDKNILPEKIGLFDSVADISITHNDSNKSRLTLDYGDVFYSFDIIYEVRKDPKRNVCQYVIKTIE